MVNRRSFLIGCGAALFSATAQAKVKNLRMTDYDRTILAMTVCGEALNQPLAGKKAVADVVFNRVVTKHPLYADDANIAVACLRRGQFTVWKHHKLRHKNYDNHDLLEMKNVVNSAYEEYINGVDFSHGALLYATKHSHPKWERNYRHTVTIGDHKFFKPLKRA